jgi:predicted DNA-binding transcriptional regulator AlpA
MSSDLGERDAYTLREFCARHGLSRAHFYRLQALGSGPRLIRAGRRVLVSREAATDWRRKMERDAEEPARPTPREQATGD